MKSNLSLYLLLCSFALPTFTFSQSNYWKKADPHLVPEMAESDYPLTIAFI